MHDESTGKKKKGKRSADSSITRPRNRVQMKTLKRELLQWGRDTHGGKETPDDSSGRRSASSGKRKSKKAQGAKLFGKSQATQGEEANTFDCPAISKREHIGYYYLHFTHP